MNLLNYNYTLLSSCVNKVRVDCTDIGAKIDFAAEKNGELKFIQIDVPATYFGVIGKIWQSEF